MTHGTVAHRRGREDGDTRRVGVCTRVRLRCVDRRGWRGVEREQVSRAFQRRAAGRTQESVGPDFGESAREYVFENARDECVHGERDAPTLVGARMRIAEGDAPVGEGFELVIGEGDVTDVPREIARRVLAAPDLLGVHGPGARPYGGIDRIRQRGPLEGGAHLRAKDRREPVARHEKARVRRLGPRDPVGCESARSDEQMRVRMVLQRAGPRVEHGEDAERAADPRAIGGEGVHGGRRFAEERGVHHRLVRARDRAELLWQGEREQVVVTGEQTRPHALEPVLRTIRLTGRAVAIATGVIGVVERRAVVTAIERAAEGRRATRDDVVDRAPVRRQQAPRVRRDVRRARGADDVRQRGHGPTP